MKIYVKMYLINASLKLKHLYQQNKKNGINEIVLVGGSARTLKTPKNV